jgi:Tol biopolymer transport system component
MQRLTDSADGYDSIVPVWSPDGRRLLFQRGREGTVTLWSMGADGTDQEQVSATPLAAEWIGGYQWLPAFAK